MALATQRPVVATNRPSDAAWMWLLRVYFLLGPILVVRGIAPFPVGAVDLLAPFTLLYFWRSPHSAGRFPSCFYFLTLYLIFLATIFGSGSVLELVRLGAIFGPFVVAFEISHRYRDALWASVFYGGLIGSGVTLGLMALGIEFAGAQQRLWVSGQGSVVRAGGLLGNSGVVGHFVAAWMVASLLVVSRKFPNRRNAIVAVVLAVGSAVLILSSSRTGMLHVTIALLVFLVARFATTGWRPTFGVGPALRTGLGLGLLWTAWMFVRSILGVAFADQALSRLNPFAFGSDADFYRSAGRWNTWQRVGEIFWELPFWGRGYQSWDGTSDSLLLDNSYLTIFVAGGVISLLTFLAFWISCARIAWRLDDLRPAALGVVSGQLVHGFLGDTVSMWYSMGFGFLILGLLLGSPRESI